MKTLNIIIIVSLIAITMFGLSKALNNGIKDCEMVECLKWQRQKQDYPLFTAPDWQVEQCQQFNIEL